METTTAAATMETTTPKAAPEFEAQPEWTLISQGAEARIWKIPPSTSTITTDKDATTNTFTIIAKERFSKSYRHPVLDEKLTKSRCKAEGRILEKCRTVAHHQKELSSSPRTTRSTRSSASTAATTSKTTTSTTAQYYLKVPKVIRIEPPVLYLEFIHGMTVRQYLEEHLLNGKEEKDESELTALAHYMGNMIGTLHGMGCIHGDLTSSNMMMRAESETTVVGSEGHAIKRAKTSDDSNKNDTDASQQHFHHDIVLIDFGLSKSTTSAEERAVDLYVLERALQSTHPHLPASFFEALLQAYKTCFQPPESNKNDTKKKDTSKDATATLQRLEQVRLRGRKRECFG